MFSSFLTLIITNFFSLFFSESQFCFFFFVVVVKVELEQYPTGPHIASRMLFTVIPLSISSLFIHFLLPCLDFTFFISFFPYLSVPSRFRLYSSKMLKLDSFALSHVHHVVLVNGYLLYMLICLWKLTTPHYMLACSLLTLHVM